tara:strand:+ start:238 stop:5694 length:5457 start_codon:yes stop_codon:yes gene_type:complete
MLDNPKPDTGTLTRRLAWTTLVVSAVVLLFRLGSPGLWDPWEINPASIARTITSSPQVLVLATESGLDDGYKEIVKDPKSGVRVFWLDGSGKATTGSLKSHLNRSRNHLKSYDYHVVIVPVETADNDKLAAFYEHGPAQDTLVKEKASVEQELVDLDAKQKEQRQVIQGDTALPVKPLPGLEKLIKKRKTKLAEITKNLAMAKAGEDLEKKLSDWADFSRTYQPGSLFLIVSDAGSDPAPPKDGPSTDNDNSKSVATLLAAKGLNVRTIGDADVLRKSLGGARALPSELVRVRPNDGGVYGVPPLRYWLVSWSYDLFGTSEFSTRLPGALLGILAIMITFIFATHLIGPWGGAFSSAILLTSPYLAVQARNFGGEIGFIAFLGLGVLGLERLMRGRRFTGLSLFGAGYVLLFLEKGVFGTLMLSMIALALMLFEWRRNASLRNVALFSWLVLGVLFAEVLAPNDGMGAIFSDMRIWVPAVLVVVLFALQFFPGLFLSQGDGEADDIDLFGRWLYWPSLILAVIFVGAVGGLIRSDTWGFMSHFTATNHLFQGGPGGSDRSFDFLMLQTGFGLLPWIVLVPFGMAGVARRWFDAKEDNSSIDGLIVLWATVPFVVIAATMLKLGHFVYPAAPALAIGVAAMAVRMGKGGLIWPVRALFVVLGLYVLLAELKLSPHPLVGSVTWDPPFVFAFEKLHRGVQYPTNVGLDSMFRLVGLLFLGWILYASIQGGEIFARLRRWSRNESAFSGVLYALLFVIIGGLIFLVARVIQGIIILNPETTGPHMLNQLNEALLLGSPVRFFFVSMLVAVLVHSLFKLLGWIQRVWRRQRSAHSPPQESALLNPFGLGRSLDLIALCLGVLGAFTLLFSAVSNPQNIFLGLLHPLILCGAILIGLWVAEHREDLFREEAVLAASVWLILYGAVVADKEGLFNATWAYTLYGLVLWFLLLRCWPRVFVSVALKRATIIVSLLGILVTTAIPLGGMLQDVTAATSYSAESPGALVPSASMHAVTAAVPYLPSGAAPDFASSSTLPDGLGLVGEPSPVGETMSQAMGSGLLLISIICLILWSIMGWTRSMQSFEARVGRSRLHMGVAISGVLAALFMATAPAMGMRTGEATMMRHLAWIPLAIVMVDVIATMIVYMDRDHNWRDALSRMARAIERPGIHFAGLVALSFVLMGLVVFRFVPDLSLHVSHKHLLETYKNAERRSDIGPNIFWHGAAGATHSKNNFYEQSIPHVKNEKTVIDILRGREDVVVRPETSRFLDLPEHVVVRSFDPRNDADGDGVRDYTADTGVGVLGSGVITDEHKSWAKDDWVGAQIIDGKGNNGKSEVGTSTNWSSNHLVDTRKKWTRDEWKGATLRIRNRGDVTVTGNDKTRLEFVGASMPTGSNGRLTRYELSFPRRVTSNTATTLTYEGPPLEQGAGKPDGYYRVDRMQTEFAGTTSRVRQFLTDRTAKWKPDQWKGAELRTGDDPKGRAGIVIGNDTDTVFFRGYPLRVIPSQSVQRYNLAMAGQDPVRGEVGAFGYELTFDGVQWALNRWKDARVIGDGNQRARERVVVSSGTNTVRYQGPPLGLGDGPATVTLRRAHNPKSTGMKDSRAYVVVPSRKLSSLNHTYRKSSGGKHIPVLDSRSSRLNLLASKISEGDKDYNRFRRVVHTTEDVMALPGVQPIEVNFEKKLILSAYRIHNSKRLVRRGQKVKVSLFFRVIGRVLKNYRIFVHIESPGADRIGADFWVLNLPGGADDKQCRGCFQTNHWMVGDVVEATFEKEIPFGSKSGRYDLWFGFYMSGGDQSRLSIESVKTPAYRTKNDPDRVKIGSFTVY